MLPCKSFLQACNRSLSSNTELAIVKPYSAAPFNLSLQLNRLLIGGSSTSMSSVTLEVLNKRFSVGPLDPPVDVGSNIQSFCQHLTAIGLFQITSMSLSSPCPPGPFIPKDLHFYSGLALGVGTRGLHTHTGRQFSWFRLIGSSRSFPERRPADSPPRFLTFPYANCIRTPAHLLLAPTRRSQSGCRRCQPWHR